MAFLTHSKHKIHLKNKYNKRQCKNNAISVSNLRTVLDSWCPYLQSDNLTSGTPLKYIMLDFSPNGMQWPSSDSREFQGLVIVVLFSYFHSVCNHYYSASDRQYKI